MHKYLPYIFFFLFVFSPFVTGAQFTQQPGSGVTLGINPETPAPNEEVSAALVGTGVNLSRASIQWFVDGEQVISGIGETQISFTTPELGERVSVRVVANTNSLGVVEKSLVVTPTEVDMLWEALGVYTPPFYKGKALPASQAAIRITAIPHVPASNGARLDPDTLSYKWQRNFRYRDFNNQSGYGAQTITYRKSMLEDTDRITAEISSRGESGQAAGQLVVPIYTPRVLFYEDHPLYGVQYDRAYEQEFSLQAQESTLVAEPYYFSVNNLENLEFGWEMEGEDVSSEGEDRKNELTVRTEGGSGEVTLSLSVSSPNYILQLLRSNLTVIFGSDEGGGTNNPFSL